MEEYEMCRAYLQQLDTRSWLSTEMQLLNRPTAPRLLLSYRMAGRPHWQPRTAFVGPGA